MTDEQTLRARLAEAEEIVFSGDQVIAAQMRAIIEMSVKHLPTTYVDALLTKFEELHTLQIEHRDRLLADLDKLLARRAAGEG
jgi:hypothetical protein